MPASLDDKCSVLAGHEFFKDLPKHALERLAAHARVSAYPPGAEIFTKGDYAHGLLAVMRGLVKISVLGEDGREVVLNRIGPGEVFGEVALLDGLPRTADATALDRSELLVLDRRDFVPLLLEEPMIAVKLLEVLSRRLRRTSQQVESLSFEPSVVRLVATLFDLAEAQGTAGMPRPWIAITQKELGQMVGLSRESTNKHLRDWAEAGWVSLDRGGCRLLNPAALRALSGSVPSYFRKL
jgi:CRP/FNR family transcriptional regulator, cyclic AMP receptor protein